MAFIVSPWSQRVRPLLLKTFVPLAMAAQLAATPEISIEDADANVLETAKLVAWGSNQYGQTTVPEEARYGVQQIAMGDRHCMALKKDGTLIPWGQGGNNEPTVPTGIGLVKAIAAGRSYNIALKENGTVIAWGSNFQSQTNVPPNLTDVQAIGAGLNHGIALKNNGTVVTWGSGPGRIVSNLSGTNAKAIAAGYEHNLTLKNDGTVVFWGTKGYPYPSVFEQYVVQGLSNVVAVSAGNGFSLALKADGTAWHWSGPTSPAQVAVPGVVAISAGGSHYVLLKNDGTVVTFGSNTYGQAAVPAGLASVTGVKAGEVNTMAIVTSRVDFGNLAIGDSSLWKTFVVKNSGTSPMHITGVAVNTGHISDFTVDTTDMLTTVPIGGQTSFTASFSPTANGARLATLRVINDDPDEGFYDINLVGTGLTQLEAWRQSYFATLDINTDTTLLGDFDKDGLSNLLEYAFATHPTQPTPTEQRIETNLESLFSFSYRRPDGGAPGVTYIVERGQGGLAAWITATEGLDYSQSFHSNGDGTETVTITLIDMEADNHFARIRVTY